jgi:hypothetical protein
MKLRRPKGVRDRVEKMIRPGQPATLLRMRSGLRLVVPSSRCRPLRQGHRLRPPEDRAFPVKLTHVPDSGCVALQNVLYVAVSEGPKSLELIVRRPFHVVDHEHFHWPFG